MDSKGGKTWMLHPNEQVHSLADRKDMSDPSGKLRSRKELKEIVALHDKGLSLNSNELKGYSIESKESPWTSAPNQVPN